MTAPEPRRWRRVDFHKEHGHSHRRKIWLVADIPRKPMRVFTSFLSFFLSGLAATGGHSRTSKEIPHL